METLRPLTITRLSTTIDQGLADTDTQSMLLHQAFTFAIAARRDFWSRFA